MSVAVTMTGRTSRDPLAAGALLLSVLAICVGVGAAIGAAVDAVGIGVAVGAVVGIPASIAAVVIGYRGSG